MMMVQARFVTNKFFEMFYYELINNAVRNQYLACPVVKIWLKLVYLEVVELKLIKTKLTEMNPAKLPDMYTYKMLALFYHGIYR